MKKWIEAARLRTLPLSLAGIFTGFAISHSTQNMGLFVLCVLTAISLQILSNFANDYGDFTKGTDNDQRVGPARTMQQGLITKPQMKAMLIFFSLFSFALAILTSFLAFSANITALLFIVLGGLSVMAAVMYTVGKNAYGYIGLGDVFVFLFFGLLSVLGTKFVLVKYIEIVDVLAASSIGLLSAAVLNLNNMRDIDNDRAQNKRTIVTKMGLGNALRYHYTLIVLAAVCIGLYNVLTNTNHLFSHITLLIFPVFILHLYRLNHKGVDTDFDPELKKVAIPTFVLSILFILQEMLK